MISARNFGSHTRSAVCFDVTGSVAPRTSANSSTRIRQRFPAYITSNHHGCSHRGLPRQPLGLQIFRTAMCSSFCRTKAAAHPPRWPVSLSRDSRRSAACDPVPNVSWIEAATPHAETLTFQLPAQVRAAHALFVAAYERCHFGCGQQPVCKRPSITVRVVGGRLRVIRHWHFGRKRVPHRDSEIRRPPCCTQSTTRAPAGRPDDGQPSWPTRCVWRRAIGSRAVARSRDRCQDEMVRVCIACHRAAGATIASGSPCREQRRGGSESSRCDESRVMLHRLQVNADSVHPGCISRQPAHASAGQRPER